MKKSTMCSVRMTPFEYAALEERCEKSGVTISDFIRAASKETNLIMIEGIPEMIVELNRIGNNINQIAKAVNYGLLTGAEADIKKADLEITDIKRELLKISRRVDICR